MPLPSTQHPAIMLKQAPVRRRQEANLNLAQPIILARPRRLRKNTPHRPEQVPRAVRDAPVLEHIPVQGINAHEPSAGAVVDLHGAQPARGHEGYKPRIGGAAGGGSAEVVVAEVDLLEASGMPGPRSSARRGRRNATEWTLGPRADAAHCGGILDAVDGQA